MTWASSCMGGYTETAVEMQPPTCPNYDLRKAPYVRMSRLIGSLVSQRCVSCVLSAAVLDLLNQDDVRRGIGLPGPSWHAQCGSRTRFCSLTKRPGGTDGSYIWLTTWAPVALTVSSRTANRCRNHGPKSKGETWIHITICIFNHLQMFSS